jgi:hypothetical protein
MQYLINNCDTYRHNNVDVCALFAMQEAIIPSTGDWNFESGIVTVVNLQPHIDTFSDLKFFFEILITKA